MEQESIFLIKNNLTLLVSYHQLGTPVPVTVFDTFLPEKPFIKLL
jgi:hypothetical protein